MPRSRSSMDTSLPLHALSADQQRDLWHMRLGHVFPRRVADLYKTADGIPKLLRPDALHKCPMCTRAKLHKANRNQSEEFECTECWQDIQVDFGFFVQRSTGRKPRSSAKPSSDPKHHVREVGLRRSSRLSAQSPPPSEQGRAPTSPSTDITLDVSPPQDSSPLEQGGASSGSPPLEQGREPSNEHPSQLYSFDRILTHEGPLSRSHKRYKGATYNVKV